MRVNELSWGVFQLSRKHISLSVENGQPQSTALQNLAPHTLQGEVSSPEMDVNHEDEDSIGNKASLGPQSELTSMPGSSSDWSDIVPMQRWWSDTG